MFDVLADRHVSEDRPVSRIPLAQTCSSAYREDTMRDQLASKLGLVEHAGVQPLGEAGRGTE